MYFKKHILAIAASVSMMSVGGVAMADNGLETKPDMGQVEFVGTIIDSPCSITPDTADQTVDMGMVSSAVLLEDGTQVVPFNIELLGCTAEAATSVSVKFTGTSAEGDDKSLAIQGAASGAAIELTDTATGDAIVLGIDTAASTLYAGDNTLQFGAQLIKTSAVNDADDIVPGEFTATANFELSYQ
ncbi:fimbrial protein [Shewanella algae]|uniref:fimbrial protein n=1 Tax=Shewanella algae TaxID=38313 RepID=UPI000F42B071|nr:fimbrial protein [Shewanella algae]AYV13681.1 type 1 fimbrial protein [Shewanella algae]